MSRQIRGLLYFFTVNVGKSFFIFWGILLGFLILNIVIASLFISGTNGNMVIGLSLAVYIYSGFFSFHFIKQGVPFVLKMGAIRKNLFAGIGVFLIGFAILLSVIVNILQSISEFIVEQLSIDGIGFKSLAELLDGRWITGFTIDATIIFLIMSIMIMFSLLFYKYGLLGGGLIVLILIFLIFGFAKGFLKDFVLTIMESFDIGFFFELGGVGILLYLLSWSLFRKFTID